MSSDPRQRRDDGRLRDRSQLARRVQMKAGDGDVVIGAGPAGLAGACMLRRRPRKSIVLGRAGRSGWSVEPSAGGVEADNVVVATGYDREPFVPNWPGLDTFAGQRLHASAYRNPQPFAGRKVLVVGAGNSAADIAVDLARGGASGVWASIRTPPQIVPRTVGGIPMQSVAVASRPLPAWVGDAIVRAVQKAVHGDLSRHGLPSPTESVSAQFRRADVVPVIDVDWVGRLKRGEIRVVAAVESFEAKRVVLADGSSLAPDAVIAATGYRRGLERLVGDLGLIDQRRR